MPPTRELHRRLAVGRCPAWGADARECLADGISSRTQRRDGSGDVGGWVSRRLWRERELRGGWHELAVVQFQDAVGRVEVLVVMGDHQDSLAAALQLGEQLPVEDILEQRVL